MKGKIGSGDESVEDLLGIADRMAAHMEMELNCRPGFSLGTPARDGLRFQELYKMTALAFAFYAMQNLRATAMLCRANLTSQAMVLVRPMWEFNVTLKYIAEDPKRRLPRFIASAEAKDAEVRRQAQQMFEEVKKSRDSAVREFKRKAEKAWKKRKKKGQSAEPVGEPPESVLPQIPPWVERFLQCDHTESEARHQEFTADYGEIDPHKWAGLDLAAMALTVVYKRDGSPAFNLGQHEYLPVFAHTSDYTHCSPKFTNVLVHETPLGEFLLATDPAEHTRYCIGSAMKNAHRIAEVYMDVWGMADNAPARVSFNQIFAEYLNL